MSSDPGSPGSDNAAEPGKSSPTARPTTRQSLRQIRDGIVVMWWAFFNWLADVSWKTLLLVSLLVFILVGILKHPIPAFLFIIASFIIKVVAGGKRRAELTAKDATKRAETEQLQRTVLEARMAALQAQIEPHFLFNTLGSIDQLIQTDPPRASKMQQSLIRYLRSAMPQMREGSRPSLGQQVDLCSALLEIMAVRMEERLQPVISVPEGLKSAVFPSMMLQTLVENAIKHGLEPKPEGGTIEIGAEVVDGQLAVQCDRHRRRLHAERRRRRGTGQRTRAIEGLVQRQGRADYQPAARGWHPGDDQSALRDRPRYGRNEYLNARQARPHRRRCRR